MWGGFATRHSSLPFQTDDSLQSRPTRPRYSVRTTRMNVLARTTRIWRAVTWHRFHRFGDLSPKQSRVQRPGKTTGRSRAFDGDKSPARKRRELAALQSRWLRRQAALCSNSEVGEHTPLACAVRRPAGQWLPPFFACGPASAKSPDEVRKEVRRWMERGFRRAAETGTRAACAPHPASEFALSPSVVKSRSS